MPFLQVQNLSKAYPGVKALSGVSLAMETGEVHALVGENGAGKSTLIKCLSGAVRPDAGEIVMDGTPIAPGDMRAATAAGISTLHQESTAFPHLNAVDNIFVGREYRRWPGILDRSRMRRETKELLDRLGETIDLECALEDLPLAQRQMVALARALSYRSRLLIMDEPSASLSTRETRILFRILRQLQAEGVGILYISHRLEEVFELASRVSVLRDGRLIATRPVRDISRDEIVRLMVGREVASLESAPKRPDDGPVILDVRGLAQAGAFSNISFRVRAGEVVGLAGLVGAGRSEVALAILGIERPASGTVHVSGRRLRPGSVRSAIAAGIALVPEDRQHQGLVLPLSVGTNLLLPALSRLSHGVWRSRRREKQVIATQMKTLAVKAADASVPAGSLSGGNQQKLVLGKWLATSPRVLLLDEPTRGVDVGAKAEVYRLVRQLADDGMSTLLISSDLPELLTLCDRILVMCEGRITGELSRAEATEEVILSLALPAGQPLVEEASHG